jgi:trk system potassium uptake protein TrkA
MVGPENSGKTLREIDFRQKYQANVIAIERKGESIPVASPEDMIYEGDVLYVAGKTEAIEKLDIK